MTTLRYFLMAKDRERASSIYMCDALWIISGALGNKLPRYKDIVSRNAGKKSNKTPKEIVDGIINVLQKDMERRLKNGESSI